MKTNKESNMNVPKLGQRVELHPAFDAWIKGDRFGTVIKITRKNIHVKLDKSGQTWKPKTIHFELNFFPID